ncbi:uncharacterized protein LOC142555919 isoform X1 [Primulina tabacum]|uniref:uncharacterized protein LOC142555919 isoform X1 n=1 Tax=Primulina tabacum TaxID=48773 RepID=UPI003F5A5F42
MQKQSWLMPVLLRRFHPVGGTQKNIFFIRKMSKSLEIQRPVQIFFTTPTILMERGINDAAISGHMQSPSRVMQGATMANISFHVTPHYGEKAENVNRTDWRDHPSSDDRIDSQMRSRRNEIQKNNKDLEKHRNQQLQYRPPSPETWRKPVEQPRPDSPPLRYGKAASAVSLPRPFQDQYLIKHLVIDFPGPKVFRGLVKFLFPDLRVQPQDPR